MNPRFAARMRDIAPFQVMEVQSAARKLEAAGRSVIHMEIGEPDFPTPAPVIKAAQQAIAQGDLYYTSALGTAELRTAIARYYESHWEVAIAPEQVMVTAGSSAALLLILALLLDRDEQVLLADPSYPCNRHFVRVLEGGAVALPVSAETAYQPSAEQIADAWSAGTRAVLLASPANPTGTTLSVQDMNQIIDTVHRQNGKLIVDEIYLGLSYQEKRETALKLSQEIFVINSFSKYFNMTGWRLGWLIAPQYAIRELEKLAQNLYISPSTPAQRAAMACFYPETLALLEERRRQFQERRDYLVPALRELGFGIPLLPSGGFFVYADCSRWSHDSERFCFDVLEATGVAFTPGTDFGSNRAEHHVRFAYTVRLEKLQEGVHRLRNYLR